MSPAVDGPSAPLGYMPSTTTPFFTRVQQRVKAWEEIGAPPLVLRWLKEGYKIPFEREVSPFRHAAWQPQSDDERIAMREMKMKLLQQGVVKPATCTNYISRSRLEPKKDGGFRLVVDLRHINAHIAQTTCKYESLNSLEDMLQPGDWMVSFDLKSGYYHVPIHSRYAKFLTTEMDGELLTFLALPFGLSTAPRVFTKVMRPFVQAMRQKGIRVLPYIDDFLLMSTSKERSVLDRRTAEELISKLGLTRNTDKGFWEPTRNLIHLGIGIDTERKIFYVPPHKMILLKGAARSLIKYAKSHKRWVSAQALAKFVGLAISLRLALQQVRTYTRSLYDALASKQSWQADVKLSRQALDDLQFFVDIDHTWNGLAVWKPPPTMEIHTDASDHGWGAVLNNVVPARGFFNDEQLKVHITEKELRAVWLGLQYFNVHLKDVRSLRLITDNQVVQSVVNKGVSKSHRLMTLIRKIQAFSRRRNLLIQAHYIPSAENVFADELSRAKDKTDWTVKDKFFDEIQQRWGARTVDRFATTANTRCQRFCSWRKEPHSLGDAMLQNWVGERNWVNPPWALIPKIVRKIRDERPEAVLLLPYWPTASWFPDVWELKDDYKIIPATEAKELVHATNPEVPEPLKNPKWQLWVVHVPERK